jgi:uncharacterized repeat protein (TIGR03803 family)
MDGRASLDDHRALPLNLREKITMSQVFRARPTAVPLAVAALLACSAVGALAAGSTAGSDNVPLVAATLNGYTVVHSMSGEGGADGQGPNGAVATGRGTDAYLYGTNFYLGQADFRCGCTIGGTVYKMAPKGQITPLHRFSGPDGFAPASGIVQGDDKLWYGVTSGGGDYGGGTAFKVSADGNTFQVLHSFGGPTNDGSYASYGALVKAPDGNFYGTAMQGGANGMGVAYRMTPAGVVTVLHQFAGAPGDGGNPRGQLMLGSDNNLYGTTVCGSSGTPTAGCGGTVYRISSSGVYTLLHSFDTKTGGYHPLATLTEINGTLYGTTNMGGKGDFGTVFSIGIDGSNFKKLYDFAGGVSASPPNADGAAPVGRLLLAPDGNLYGTTSRGGPNTQVYPKGDGTIYRITPTGTYTLLGAFGSTAQDGSHPVTGLTLGNDGLIYGTTDNGGANLTGTIFSFPVPTH